MQRGGKSLHRVTKEVIEKFNRTKMGETLWGDTESFLGKKIHYLL